jgi:phosphatidylinositol alpha-1,6-mannosyltransferase
MYRAVDQRMVRAADRVLSNSPYGARRLWRAYRRRATVIEHGVDFAEAAPEKVEELRQRYGLGDRPVAVTVNHLHPRKRVDLFLEAAHRAAGRVRGTTALVVGGGPEEARLRVLACELGMEVGRDVLFTGAVPEEELPAHYALGDVYVHTGKEESFGLSVIEALFTGLPVVSVDEGGPCDTVQHGISGYLVPPTAEALGTAVANLLSGPAKAKSMGAAGSRFVVTHFRWERGVETLMEVIRKT